MSTFGIAGDDFVLDGRPHRVLSGAIHYFRVPPELWADRIHKARLMGLNAIETYVPWNLHEPRQGEWVDSGPVDLRRFLTAVADEGMHAIVRPGPYICAEWTNGGLPAWLFRDPEVGVRRNEPRFMAAVERYLQRVYEIVAPLQISNGGPVILVQVENEYGAYGADADYLRALVDVTTGAGITVPLTTVDQPAGDMLVNGSLPGLLKTASFGSRSVERLAILRAHQSSGPLMCSEYWDGWFDSWGEHHHVTDVETAAADLDAMLTTGASVNIYMFHGGTNFGFTNGANDKGVYKPIVTSYDYDAPLDEAGNPTPKYWAFRDVLARHTAVPAERPGPAAAAPELTVPLVACVPLADVQDALGSWRKTDVVPTFDELAHDGPLMIYRTDIDLDAPAVLGFDEVRDHARVFLDGRPIGSLARDHHESGHHDPGRAGHHQRARRGPGACRLRSTDRREQRSDRAGTSRRRTASRLERPAAGSRPVRRDLRGARRGGARRGRAGRRGVGRPDVRARGVRAGCRGRPVPRHPRADEGCGLGERFRRRPLLVTRPAADALRAALRCPSRPQ